MISPEKLLMMSGDNNYQVKRINPNILRLLKSPKMLTNALRYSKCVTELAKELSRHNNGIPIGPKLIYKWIDRNKMKIPQSGFNFRYEYDMWLWIDSLDLGNVKHKWPSRTSGVMMDLYGYDIQIFCHCVDSKFIWETKDNYSLLNSSKFCKNQARQRFIHIFDVDWYTKKDAIKRLILLKILNKNEDDIKRQILKCQSKYLYFSRRFYDLSEFKNIENTIDIIKEKYDEKLKSTDCGYIRVTI